MLPAKAASSLEKSTVRGGSRGPRGLRGGAPCLVWTVHPVCFCLWEATAISLSKFSIFLEVRESVLFREAVKLIVFVVASGLGGKRWKHHSGEAVESLQALSCSTNQEVDSIRGSWKLLAYQCAFAVSCFVLLVTSLDGSIFVRVGGGRKKKITVYEWGRYIALRCPIFV